MIWASRVIILEQRKNYFWKIFVNDNLEMIIMETQRHNNLVQPGDHPGMKRNKYGKYLSGDDLGNNPGN